MIQLYRDLFKINEHPLESSTLDALGLIRVWNAEESGLPPIRTTPEQSSRGATLAARLNLFPVLIKASGRVRAAPPWHRAGNLNQPLEASVPNVV